MSLLGEGYLNGGKMEIFTSNIKELWTDGHGIQCASLLLSNDDAC